MDIQVDMFEVQLGAALLIEFRTARQTIRVLADAGTSMGGYPAEHLLDKLRETLPPTRAHPRPRIDLLIGTHYDADHLNRMPEVIAAYEIGEAWLPPVANDTEPPAAGGDAPRDGHFLGRQFAGEQGAQHLHDYLQAKADTLAGTAQLRASVVDGAGEDATLSGRVAEGEFARLAAVAGQRVGGATYGDDTFTAALQRAARVLGEPVDHACGDARLAVDHARVSDAGGFDLHARSFARRAPDAAARSLASIERSTAKEAISATCLKQVVDALEAHQVPTRYESVPDGQPVHFRWDRKSRRFMRTTSLRSNALGLTLLGPSRALIAKHWDRLPIGEYQRFALMQALPVEDITPANQLSYALVLRCSGQRILVAGDTGFVDFKPLDARGRKLELYPALVEQLAAPLQVVQVAHHGGHNKYFYHALEAAKFPQARSTSYLLLSHEVKSKSRPSKVFATFLERMGKRAGRIRVLFTSQPRTIAVRDFENVVAAVAPKGASGDRGDVRLQYKGNRWRVSRHAVKVR